MTKQLPPLAQLVVFLVKDLVSLQLNPHVTSSKGSLSPYGVETQLSGLAVYPSDHRWWMGSFDCLYVLFLLYCSVLFCFVYLSFVCLLLFRCNVSCSVLFTCPKYALFFIVKKKKKKKKKILNVRA